MVFYRRRSSLTLNKVIVFIIVFALAFTATVMIGLGLAYLTLL